MDQELMKFVQQEYELIIQETKTIHDTEKTRAMKLSTNQGKFLLKTLFCSDVRQLFILQAENYLRTNGIMIPESILTLNHEPFIVWRGHPYVMQRWVTGKHYPLINEKRVKQMGSVLGRIHRASIGFHNEHGPVFFDGDKWLIDYTNKLSAIKTWKEMNEKDLSLKTEQIYQSLDYFLNIGNEIRKRIEQSPFYHSWINYPLLEHFLSHGDFHTHNVKVDGSSFYVIDWEDVKYDFVSKDLTRILFVMMRRHNKWDLTMFNILLDAYLHENPLSKQQKGLLFLDLTFPHIFFRFLDFKTYQRVSSNRVRDFLIRERLKTEYLIKLALGK